MANIINYAERFERILVQKYEAEAKSNDLILSNPGVTFINAQTIKLPRLTMSGYKDHTRTPGFNMGVLSNDWEPKKLEHDRDVEFFIDPMDIDETNLAVSIANIQNVFETEQAIPETDSYRFSKIYAEYVKYGQTADTTALTAANILATFDTWMSEMDDAGVPEEGRILYVTAATNKLLKEAQGLERMINVSPSATTVSRKIRDLDDVRIIVVPSGRMKTAYNFTNGCVPAIDAAQINAILIHPNSVVAREKYDYIRLFTPGSDSRTGDGYIYQNRKYGDLFLLEKRLDGVKINVTADAISEITVAGETNSMYEVNPSVYQSGITVSNGNITGTLTYMSASNAITDYWGAGYFIGLKLTAADWSAYSSVKVGLEPSAGTGLVEIKNDDTHNLVAKITSKDLQKFVVVASNGSVTETNYYDLSGLTLSE